MFRLFEFGCALLQFVDALLQRLLFPPDRSRLSGVRR
jgi:hypothetical protein